MNNIRRGLLAGLGAGLMFASLQFVNDNTPGRTLPAVTHWFGLALSDPTASRVLGFLLLIVLGAILGCLFGIVQRADSPTLGRSLLQGLLFGLAYWLIFPLFLGTLKQGVPLGFSDLLANITLSLLFGLLLGTIYHTLGSWQGAVAA